MTNTTTAILRTMTPAAQLAAARGQGRYRARLGAATELEAVEQTIAEHPYLRDLGTSIAEGYRAELVDLAA